MDPISVITPPLIGGIIGYLTNDLAIKMLFRPYKAMHLGRFRLPFTPGIVPRRLEDLAVLLGREVEARFFNADDLEILFQSQEFSATVAESITDMIFSRRYSLCYVMEGLERSEEMGPALDCAKRALCEKTLEALKEFDYAPLIERAVGELSGRLPRAGAASLLNLAPSLSEGIREYLEEHGEETVYPLLERALVDFGDRPIKDMAQEAFPQREKLCLAVQKLYLNFMSVYVRKVVESIDVGGMITEKLRLMEPQAVEALILSVVNREFRYVVWLGGLLGAVIGVVNMFI